MLHSVAVCGQTAVAPASSYPSTYLCKSDTTFTRSNFYPPLHIFVPKHYTALLSTWIGTVGHGHINFSSLSFFFLVPDKLEQHKRKFCISHRLKCLLLICGVLPLVCSLIKQPKCHVSSISADNAQRVQGGTYSKYLNQIWTQQYCYCTMPELSELKEKKKIPVFYS